MNNKKINVWLPLLFSLAMIIGMFLGYTMKDGIPGKSFFYVEKRRPIQEVMDLIENKYVDEVDFNNINDTAIKVILSKLDPHSIFISSEELQRVNEDLSGNFFGIGIQFSIINDTINVISVSKDGPSDKAGIQTGDKLIKVNDSLVAHVKITPDEIRKILRGEKGSNVTLTILHDATLKTISLKRDLIPLPSLDAAYMIAPGIGYIRLNKFSQESYREFMIALESLKKQGLQKLIFDLRDNGGGILEDATEIADEFLGGSKLITYTEGRHSTKKEYRCKRPGLFEEGKLVVLANEGSASASEVLLGALQDWDRATIIGRRSFGKGLVQEQYNLSDGSALRLTIARYYTPIGRSIQRDYTHGGQEYYEEIYNRYTDGELYNGDSIKNDTNKTFKTLGGKIVYGGGGITPDIFVGIDSTLNAKTTLPFYAKNTINEFAYIFYLSKKEKLSQYKNIGDFSKNFAFSDDDWKRFLTKAAGDSIHLSTFSIPEKEILINKIKAGISQIIWYNEGFFEIINEKDNTIAKALELLQ